MGGLSRSEWYMQKGRFKWFPRGGTTGSRCGRTCASAASASAVALAEHGRRRHSPQAVAEFERKRDRELAEVEMAAREKQRHEKAVARVRSGDRGQASAGRISPGGVVDVDLVRAMQRDSGHVPLVFDPNGPKDAAWIGRTCASEACTARATASS